MNYLPLLAFSACLFSLVSLTAQRVYPIDIGDVALERAVRQVLNLPAFEQALLKSSDLESLRSLSVDASWPKIRNLASLRNARFLSRISLKNQEISDLSPVANLSLSSAQFPHNRISDFSPLMKSPFLEVINLAGNQISDLSPFYDFFHLQMRPPAPSTVVELRINLSDNQIEDLSPLRHFATAHYREHYVLSLNLRDNQIRDLSPLEGLRISDLVLSGNPIEDFSPLQKIHFFEMGSDSFASPSLYLGDTAFSDLGLLNELNASSAPIRLLNVSNCPISEFAHLAALTELQVLDLNDTQISDLAPMAGLTQLSDLRLARTPITNLEALQGLLDLQTLDLSGTLVRDLAPLVHTMEGVAPWISVRTLLMRECQLSDLSLFEALHGHVLGGLNLAGNPFSDLTPLTGIEIASGLTLSDTLVSDLRPLEAFSEFTSLSIDGSKVTDLEPLRSLPNLRILNLGRLNIADYSPLQSLPGLLDLDLSENGLTDVSFLSEYENLTSVWFLNLRGNAITDPTPVLAFHSATNLAIFPWYAIDLSENRLDLRPGTPARAVIDSIFHDLRFHAMPHLFPQKSTSYPWEATPLYKDDWRLSGWYGWLKETHYPWQWHVDHGWQFVEGNDPTSLWIWDVALHTWLWVSANTYPWIYRETEGPTASGWLLYLQPTRTPSRWFFDPALSDWRHEVDLP